MTVADQISLAKQCICKKGISGYGSKKETKHVLEQVRRGCITRRLPSYARSKNSDAISEFFFIRHETLFIKWTINAFMAISLAKSTPFGLVNDSGGLAGYGGHG